MSRGIQRKPMCAVLAPGMGVGYGNPDKEFAVWFEQFPDFAKNLFRMVHVLEGMVEHDEIELSRHFEEVPFQDFQIGRVLEIFLQKRIYPRQVFETAALHG